MNLLHDRRPIQPLFLVAWILLVVVVAFGFYVQARTIDRLEDDEQAIISLVHQVNAQQTRSAEVLCGLLIHIDPSDAVLIQTTFEDLGYGCMKGGE